MNSQVKPVSVKLDQGIISRIESLAKIQRRTAHWMMKEAIRQYVEREERQDDFRQATLQAWEEFVASGLYATSDEVEAWLASWGTDDERPVPSCHG